MSHRSTVLIFSLLLGACSTDSQPPDAADPAIEVVEVITPLDQQGEEPTPAPANVPTTYAENPEAYDLEAARRNRAGRSVRVGRGVMTTRDLFEDLEVIQEKRQIRIRKPRQQYAPRTVIEVLNRQPATNTETYRNPGQNHWVATQQDNLSTFAADIDGGSYTVARRKLNEGLMPPADSVRPEEWVNYFNYDYPAPTSTTFGVSLEAAPSPFHTSTNYRMLRVGVQGKSFASAERTPVHLTFLVDVSGSMTSADKLGLAVKSLKQLVRALDEDDTVAIATYAGRTEMVLPHTSAAQQGKIFAALDQLQSGGSTAMDDGLAIAYELAQSVFVPGHENRVLVLSDGDANVGRTSVEEMHKTIAAGAKRGITLSTIGFGMGNYQEAAMEELANKGNGNYFYIDTLEEAQRIFGEQADATLRTIARDVKLQVEFNPDAVKRYRLIGYENRDIADEDFRNDSVDAGEVGAGHAVTALYELELADPNAGTLATVRVRHHTPDKQSVVETAAVMPTSLMVASLGDASDSFQFAAAVAAFAEIVRKSPYASHLNYDWVREVASAATEAKPERHEFVALVDKAKSLASRP